MSATSLYDEYMSLTVPVPLLRRKGRALMGLRGMADDEWLMITISKVPGRQDEVYLDEIFVPTDYRGRKFGTLGLEWLHKLAVKHGVSIIGEVRPYGYRPALGRYKLRDWYKRHGFVVTGRGDGMQCRLDPN